VLTEHDMPIAPSTYYARRQADRVSQADWDDAHAANALFDLWRANRGLYGVEKLAGAARRAGLNVGRDQVGRLMALLGICGVTRGRHATVTTRRDAASARHPDRCKRAWNTPSRPDEWWVADFTYVWTLAGFVYVSFVTDVYSRRILGWRTSKSKTTPLVLSALEQALFTRDAPTSPSPPPASSITPTPAASTRPWRSPRPSSMPASPDRSALSATPWTTR
jgi:putative transposase